MKTFGTRRSAQDIIAALPSIIAVDGQHCGEAVIVVKPPDEAVTRQAA